MIVYWLILFIEYIFVDFLCFV